MMSYCTHYNALVSHPLQLEVKLMAALHAARANSGPVHLSIPVDILSAQCGAPMPTHEIAPLLDLSPTIDLRGISAVAELLEPHGPAVILVGARRPDGYRGRADVGVEGTAFRCTTVVPH